MRSSVKILISACLLFALAGPNVFGAKTMVIFTGGTDTVRALSSLDSIKFTGASPAYNFVMHKGGANIPVGFSIIDSIRFYDGVAVFTPEMLYNAFAASPMMLTAGKSSVTLDLGNLKSGFTGEIITDPIDFLDTANNAVSTLGSLYNVTVMTQSTVPGGASINLFYKTGNTFFTETGWSSWTAAPATSCDLSGLSGRYLKLRFALATNSKAALPQISRVAAYASLSGLSSFTNPIALTAFQNEKIVTGPYAVGWESRDNTRIHSLITSFRLDTTGTGKTGFSRITALLDWVARRPRNAGYPWSPSPYPWNLDQLISSGGTITGDCTSYAIVMISALTGLGYYARHWAMQGIDNDNNHEIVEWWSDSLRKWVYLDPSLDTYYKNTATQAPMSIREMHNIYITEIGQANQTTALACVDAHYHYGVYTPTYDWRTFQGYTTTGYMQLTERNNFHSQALPSFNGFGQGFWGYSDVNLYHDWMDSLTPTLTLDTSITCQSGRTRDFWYTLNQASIKAKRGAEGALTLDFGNSQPFFKQYAVSVDGGAAIVQAGAAFAWTLHSGVNTVTVSPEDNWGGRGLSSSMTVTF